MALRFENWTGGPLSNNIYLFWDDAKGDAVLIDPSIESEPARRKLDDLERAGVHLRAIWNTHGHFDHVYDNARWKAEYSVPLLMHGADRFLLEHLREQAIWFGLEAPEVVQPDIDLTAVAELNIGDSVVRVLHTPGHSPGSVSFWFPAEKLCVSGDVLFRGSVGRTDLPGCSEEALLQSLRTLAALPLETRILPGHGPGTTIGEELASNPHYLNLKEAAL